MEGEKSTTAVEDKGLAKAKQPRDADDGGGGGDMPEAGKRPKIEETKPPQSSKSPVVTPSSSNAIGSQACSFLLLDLSSIFASSFMVCAVAFVSHPTFHVLCHGHLADAASYYSLG
ncbi:hypothetical protein FEM48_ZijujUnG0018700 [Ziziphus jujuba var. spinosa]|uniref:Uncharacterized protein n=1 Tax=Ziziphus jujuba var. spinosa TaxID=714518 RepID=A0A978U9T8_ZIZJJ|nr:hypothetical protein FEM48_ZijujUnG0018700 [Ziziphus jujuba var. spinosa]